MSELTRPPETESKLRRGTGPLPGTAFATEWTLAQAAGTSGSSPDAPAVAVVGFDGSEPAQRALDAATELLHLQRRDDAIAHELLDAADELRRQRGPDATIVLVVGGSSDRHPHVAGCVSSNSARVDRLPLVVVS